MMGMSIGMAKYWEDRKKAFAQHAYATGKITLREYWELTQ